MKNVLSYILIFFALLHLTACTPQFDWREQSIPALQIKMVFPAKTKEHTQDIQLKDHQYAMTMQATRIDEISFALAYINAEKYQLNEAQQNQALEEMKQGMIQNIQGKMVEEKNLPLSTIKVEGKTPQGDSMIWVGKFFRKENYLVQLIVLGKKDRFEKNIKPEVLDMYFNSIKN